MSFDLEAARDFCAFLNGKKAGGFDKQNTQKVIDTVNDLLPAALDEIERLQEFRSRIARILMQSPSDCDDLLILGLDSRIILTKRQAKRIAELQSLNDDLMANGNSLRARAQRAEARVGELEEANLILESQNKQYLDYNLILEEKSRHIEKQRAALTKLGQAKRERGKALVDERARCIHHRGRTANFCNLRQELHREKYYDEARRQLAAEHPDLFGPEDIAAKPAKIILTEEQRVALEHVCDLADEYECKYASTADERSNAIDTVRALLQEARP
jgi:hypothetical protein